MRTIKEYRGLSRFVYLAMALLLLLCTTLVSCSEESGKAEQTALLSPAMSIIASESGMAKSALVGESIKFTSEDFARVMNIPLFEM